jgi:lysine 2,3-aminomutase
VSRARWQVIYQNALKSGAELEAFFQAPFPKLSYPICIPLPLAERIKLRGLDSPLARQFLPHKDELLPGGLVDPIGDHQHSPTPQIVHRYGSRALLMPTTVCPVICRYCFRKNELYSDDELFKPKLEEALNYLKGHEEIEEVILSGGDPLMLSDKKLAQLIERLVQIPHLRFLRFHTRALTTLPERFSSRLLTVLNRAAKRFDRVSLVFHLNHASELSPKSLKIVGKLRKMSLDLYSQSVLLHGINDSTDTLYELFSSLAQVGITPYYLHHPDSTQGARHFMVALETGRRLYAPLREKLPGWALPRYVLEIPDGGGKTDAFNPESLNFSGTLLTRTGQTVKVNFK